MFEQIHSITEVDLEYTIGLTDQNYDSVHSPDSKSIKTFKLIKDALFDSSSLEDVSESYMPFRLSRLRNKWKGSLDFYIVLLCFNFQAPLLWQFVTFTTKYGGLLFIILYLILYIFISYPLAILKAFIGQFCTRSFTDSFNYCILFRGIGLCYLIYTLLNLLNINIYSTWLFVALGESFFLYNDLGELELTEGDNQSYDDAYKAEYYFQVNILESYSQKIDATTILPFNYITYLIFIFVGFIHVILVGFNIRFSMKFYGIIIVAWFLFILLLITSSCTFSYAFEIVYLELEVDFKILLQPDMWYSLVRLVVSNTLTVHSIITVLASYNDVKHQINQDVYNLLIVSFVSMFLFSFGIIEIIFNHLKLFHIDIRKNRMKLLSGHALFTSTIFGLSKMWIPLFWLFMYLGTLILINISAGLTTYLVFNTALLDLIPNLRRYRYRLLIINLLIITVLSVFGALFFIRSGYFYIIMLDRILYGAGPALLYFLEWSSYLCYGIDNFIEDYSVIFKFVESKYFKFYFNQIMPALLFILFIVLLTPFHPYDLYYRVVPDNILILELTNYMTCIIILIIVVSVPIYDYRKFNDSISFIDFIRISLCVNDMWGPGDKKLWKSDRYGIKMSKSVKIDESIFNVKNLRSIEEYLI